MGRVGGRRGRSNEANSEEDVVYTQRQPFIVGQVADQVLGFVAGFFGSVMGVIATVAVMFLWAGSDPAPDTEVRRHHATSVSIWSGVGCAIPFVLGLILVVALVGAATVVTTTGGSAPMPFPTPVQVYP